MKRANEDMLEAGCLLDDGKYLLCARKLEALNSVVCDTSIDLSSCDEERAKAFEALKVELTMLLEKLHLELGRQWDAAFKITEETTNSTTRGAAGRKLVTLQLGMSREELKHLTEAMHSTELLEFRVNRFALRLLNLVLKPVVRHHVVVSEDLDKHAVKIEWQDNQKLRPQSEDVFDSLAKVFKLLIQDLDNELLSQIGSRCYESFSQTLVDECLRHAVPSTKEELPLFEPVARSTEAFVRQLIQHGFAPEEVDTNPCPIISFVRDIDDTFAEKRVASILETARAIMKEDLHNARTVDETKKLTDTEFAVLADKKLKLGSLDTTEASPELEELGQVYGFSVHDSLFRFPRCQVSAHVFKLLDLVNSTLEESCASPPRLAARLICVARTIFQLYRDVMPIFHRDVLARFPQHCALALTNCMYLAYECSTLGFAYRQLLPEAQVAELATFADIIAPLRTEGRRIFQRQLQEQRQQLRAVLSQLRQLLDEQHQPDSAALPPRAEQCLRQVVHQLRHLRQVWQHVLPSHVYSRAIGLLLDAVVDELTNHTLALEDIAADSATQMATLFAFVEEKAPEIFVIDDDDSSSRHDVVRFVCSWQRFKELIFVLNASLREIEDRWAGGKGPLAVEFTAEQVKQLVRALFQNTDRRAAVLSRIK